MHDVSGWYLPTQPGQPELHQLSRCNIPFNLNGGDRLIKLRELRTWDVLQCGGRECLRLLRSRPIRLIDRSSSLYGVCRWYFPSIGRVELMRQLRARELLCGLGDQLHELLEQHVLGCIGL